MSLTHRLYLEKDPRHGKCRKTTVLRLEAMRLGSVGYSVRCDVFLLSDLCLLSKRVIRLLRDLHSEVCFEEIHEESGAELQQEGCGLDLWKNFCV